MAKGSTQTNLYSGGTTYDDAYKKKYPDKKPTFDQDYNSNLDWFKKKSLVKDQSLLNKGYQYYTGSADTPEAKLRAAGYVKNSEAGGVGGSSANGWYLPPKKAAAPAAAKKSSGSTAKKTTTAAKTHPGGVSKTGLHYNPDKNANLKEATIWGNENNTLMVENLNRFARNRARDFNTETQGLTTDAKNRLDSAYGDYNNEMTGLMNNMGTADHDIHTRNRGAAFAGLDRGFSEAGDQLAARLAQRGIASSGVAAGAMKDLSRDRAIAGSQAGVNAYTSAIDMSDARRNNRMGTLGTLYGAKQANINNGYQMQMSDAGQRYGNDVAVEGQAMQNTINNNQQRIANLMGYSQLGRGMAGMAGNYLAQAGTGFGNIAGMAGQTAIGIGNANNSYNATMQNAAANQANAKAQAQAGKGSAVGSLVGAGITKFSDERLKKNIKEICTINGHRICSWDWNDKGIEICGHQPTIGVIAQEAMAVDPTCVTIADNGYYQVDYNKVFSGVAS